MLLSERGPRGMRSAVSVETPHDRTVIYFMSNKAFVA